MSQGAIDTPAGPITPVDRIWGYDGHRGDKQELPSAGKVFTLEKGVSRLSFTGQEWPAHPTRGIDWDLYVLAPEDQEAHTGNWSQAWHGSPGMDAFRTANRRPFEERQDILRIRGRSGFMVILVTHLKGQRPKDLAVRIDGRAIVTGKQKSIALRLRP